MGITVLYGTNRSDLRATCLSRVCGLMQQWPQRRAILLVPEQTKMDMEREYLSQSGSAGLMMAEVLSFRRLAWRLLGEVGRQPVQPIDSVGQAMLIHRVLRQQQNNLHTFGHLADRPGFINQVAAAIGDLKRYQVDGEQLSAAGSRLNDKVLQHKLADLGLALQGYDAALQDVALSDAEDDLNRLDDALRVMSDEPDAGWPWRRLAWLRTTDVWVCGFGESRDFTPQEDAVLDKLITLTRQVTLTVAADHFPADYQTVEQGPDQFFAGRKTAWRLLMRHPGLRTERVANTSTGLPARLSDCLINGTRPQAEDGVNSDAWLRLVQAESRDDEIGWIAAEIDRLVRSGQYRYRDMTLAVCDFAGYAPALRTAFRNGSIPAFFDINRSLSGTMLMRLVLGLLDIGLTNWSRPALMACLRSGLTPLEPDAVDRLENLWLARGLFRADRIFADRFYTEADLISLRDRILQVLRRALQDLYAQPDVAGKCRTLIRLLHDLGVRDRIDARVTQLADRQAMDEAVALARSWNELDRVLEQLERLAGSMPLSLQGFRDTLAAGMEAAAGGVIPSAIDQVTVSDLRRAVLRRPRILFLIGASAGHLPPAPPAEGLLKDMDRQILSGLIDRQLPSHVRDQTHADALMVHSLFTLPSDRLVVSAPDSAVSTWFAWLAGFCPQSLLYVQAAPLHCPADKVIVAEADDQLPQDRVAALVGDPIIVSVTQLEQYAACPFKHLSERLLALTTRPVWQPEATETGLLLHGILELALKAIHDDLETLEPDATAARTAVWQQWLSRNLAEAVTAWMQAAMERDGLQRLLDDGLQASIGRRIKRTATAAVQTILDQYRQDSYQPAELEWTFGQTGRRPILLVPPGRSPVILRGKIDRIDHGSTESGPCFRIVDYKSGRRALPFDELFNGLSLQLPLYLTAYSRTCPSRMALEAAYFQISRPLLAWPPGPEPSPEEIKQKLDQYYVPQGFGMAAEDLVRVCDHALAKAQNWVGELLSGRFPAAPAKLPGQPPACVFCRFQAVCGFDVRSGSLRRLGSVRCSTATGGGRLTRRASYLACLKAGQIEEQ